MGKQGFTRIKGTQAVFVVEEWGRRYVRFSWRVRMSTSWGVWKRERVMGGRGCAAAISEDAAFAADFERAVYGLSRGRRVLVIGVALLGLAIARAGKIASFAPGECYRAYEEACVEIYREMVAGGYEA